MHRNCDARRPPHRPFVALAASLALLGAAAQPEATLPAWSQETVAAAAAELAALIRSFEKTTGATPEIMDRSERGDASAIKFMNAVDSAARVAEQLAQDLADGLDRDATLGRAGKLQGLLRDARAQGRGITNAEYMAEKTAPMQKLIDVISPYYFELDPEAAARAAP